MIPQSLRFKINSAIIITITVIALIFSTILIIFEVQRRTNVIKQIKLSLNDLMLQKRDQLGEEIFNEHTKAIKATLNDIMKRDGILSVSTYDFEGSLLVTTEKSSPPDLTELERESLSQAPSFIDQNWNNEPVLTYSSIIKAYGEEVGYLRIHYSLSVLRQETLLIITIFSALLLTMFLLMAGMLNVLLSRLVLKPVYVLRNAMQRVKEGKLGEQVTLQTGGEIGEMAETFNKMSVEIAITTSTFEKFVPRQFLERIAKDGIDSIKRGMVTNDYITILFSDIRSFTTLSEMMHPGEVFEFLNSYLSRMNAPIVKYNGYVDKFIGDAIMALFDQQSGTNYQEALSAVQAAIEMQNELTIYNQHRCANGYMSVSTGIGIHSGQVIIGTLGSENRMDSTAIGDAVNLAARLESLTKYYNCHIIVSSATFKLLKNEYPLLWRELDYVVVKGKKEPVSIFEIFNSDPEEIRDKKHQILTPYHEGLMNFHIRKWDEAIQLFQQCLDLYPTDVVSQMYISRSQKFKENPPAADWNGALILEHK